MKKNRTEQPSLNEIIFQGRNKEYGAYELRTGYAKRMRLAVYLMGFFPLLIYFFAVRRSTSATTDTAPVFRFKEEMTTTSVHFDPIEIPETRPAAGRAAPAAATSAFVSPPRITTTPDPSRAMASQADLINTVPGAVNLPGVPYTGMVIPPAGPVSVGNGDNLTGNEILDVVQVEASFPGGERKWIQYLQRNADGEVATTHEAPSGTYTVMIKFVVDTLGNISDVHALTAHGYGMENEAIRVIQRGPRWVPAQQNGHRVKAYRKQPITFRVESEQ